MTQPENDAHIATIEDEVAERLGPKGVGRADDLVQVIDRLLGRAVASNRPGPSDREAALVLPVAIT